MTFPMYLHILTSIDLSRPTCQLFHHLPDTIRLVILFHKLIHGRKNTAQYGAYLNTIFIYIRLLERFYKAKTTNFYVFVPGQLS